MGPYLELIKLWKSENKTVLGSLFVELVQLIAEENWP